MTSGERIGTEGALQTSPKLGYRSPGSGARALVCTASPSLRFP